MPEEVVVAATLLALVVQAAQAAEVLAGQERPLVLPVLLIQVAVVAVVVAALRLLVI